MTEETNLYQLAFKNWGKPAQVAMMIEEMSELTQVLLHDLRNNKSVTIIEIANEIADVKIMLEQMIYVYKISELVAIKRKRKLRKLKKYLEADNG